MNKRYWLRGGIIGLSYLVLILILAYSFYDGETKGWFAYIADFPGMLLGHFIVSPALLFFHISDSKGYIAVVIANFIIGATIGWIYGKIKNRNKVMRLV